MYWPAKQVDWRASGLTFVARPEDGTSALTWPARLGQPIYRKFHSNVDAAIRERNAFSRCFGRLPVARRPGEPLPPGKVSKSGTGIAASNRRLDATSSGSA